MQPERNPHGGNRDETFQALMQNIPFTGGKMKVLVVGGGGREHAILWKLSQSKRKPILYCAPGNAGIASLASCVPVKATDLDGMLAFVKKEGIDLVFVAPDDPLALGMVNIMQSAGIRTFGPTKEAAVIEASKAFSKDLMNRYGIPTAAHQVFHRYQRGIFLYRQAASPDCNQSGRTCIRERRHHRRNKRTGKTGCPADDE